MLAKPIHLKKIKTGFLELLKIGAILLKWKIDTSLVKAKILNSLNM